MDEIERRRSWIWFLFPVFTGIIGGLIAYFALKFDEPRMAKDCLYIGITLTGLNVGTLAIMIGIGFTFEDAFNQEFNNVPIGDI